MSTYGGRVVPLSAPFRAFDTRDYATRLGPNQKEAWNFQPFVDSLNSGWHLRRPDQRARS